MHVKLLNKPRDISLPAKACGPSVWYPFADWYEACRYKNYAACHASMYDHCYYDYRSSCATIDGCVSDYT